MNEPTCNWQVTLKDEDGDVVTDEVGREKSQACGKPAGAIYSRLNPERRQPDQPRFKTFPACKTHDTPARRKAAKEQGYDREVL